MVGNGLPGSLGAWLACVRGGAVRLGWSGRTGQAGRAEPLWWRRAGERVCDRRKDGQSGRDGVQRRKYKSAFEDWEDPGWSLSLASGS